MYSKAFSLALGAIAISGSTASPIQSNTTVINCNDVTTGLDPSCWAKLNMSSWLLEWASRTPGAGGQASTEGPADPAASDISYVGDIGFRRRAAGCEDNELWSTCFLRLGLGQTGHDCSKIDLGGVNCVAPKAGGPPQTPQIYYGVWNIYAVNRYISSVYSALQEMSQEKQDAIRAAASSAPGDIHYSFPASYSVDSVLIQLLFKQTNNRELPGSPNTPLATLLEAYPSKQKYDQNTDLEDLTMWMQDSLANTVPYIMSDLPAFIKFAENGAFSMTNLTTVAQLVKSFEA